MDKRYTLPIKEIIADNPNVKTFVFDLDLKAKPGQYMMLAHFGFGEKPFSIANIENGLTSITIKKVGAFTQNLFALKPGDFLSLRGPYGTNFSIKTGAVLLIGGGCGFPPLYFLAKRLAENRVNTTIINGAKTKDDLVLADHAKLIARKAIITTDDGITGETGTTIDAAKKLLTHQEFNYVYAAGPEFMLVKLIELCKKYNLDYEFSFERYMKCGVGICGQCAVDPTGLLLCKEGPVLKRNVIEKITEFGRYKRDATGAKIYFPSK
ncbi:MAG: dihydroorotate dehydrogenase electron transfer subunit [Gammaproteobacteria bacterium]|nr:dihydroorotate dehydrogenase electron transfer subunit [Gammaproteobacteria bacterium]